MDDKNINEMMQEFENLTKAAEEEPNEPNVQEFDAKAAEPPKKSELQFPDLSNAEGNIGLLMGVKLLVTVELGRANLSVKEVLELQKGSVVELDRIAGEAVDIYVNDSLIARGDVVVVDDKFGVRVTELVPIEKSSG